MPFTLAHPAAAIPLKNLLGKYGILSALIIGSLTPDFIYFLPLPFSRIQTHSLLALIWFCLPAGIIAWLLFQHILKRPLIALLPDSFQKRLAFSENVHYSSLKISGIILSLLIGAATHLLWDSFTHADSPIVQNSPVLNFLIFEIMGYKVWVYKLLQHGSTFLGIALIIYWIWNWYRKTEIIQINHKPYLRENTRKLILVILLTLPVFASIWHGQVLFSESITIKTIQTFVGDTLRSGIALIMSGLVIYSLTFRYKQKT